MLGHCLGKSRSYLYAWGEKEVSSISLEIFQGLIKKRQDDYPIAYLLGTQGFWSLDLKVTEDVLIPRPETELLVEMALEKIKNIKSPNILDLGTGSGAIALALAVERPDAEILASDYSEKALVIAQKNAQLNGISNVNFVQSNWFENITSKTFDLIVSNPPYISSNDPHLKQSIRHEPLQALASGKAGLDDICAIFKQAPAYMKNNTWILIEHGYDQGDIVPKLMSQMGFLETHCVKDCNDNNRLSMGKKG